MSCGPRRMALVWVAGGSVRVSKGTTRTDGLNSITRGELGLCASDRHRRSRPSGPCSARTRRVWRVGWARSASPASQRRSAELARIHCPAESSPGTTTGCCRSPSVHSTRKKVASKRIGERGGVTQRPAKLRRDASSSNPQSAIQAAKSRSPASRRSRARTSSAGPGSVPRAKRTPTSSNNSRSAQATWATD